MLFLPNYLINKTGGEGMKAVTKIFFLLLKFAIFFTKHRFEYVS